MSTASVILSLMFLLCLASCGAKVNPEALWATATYREDTELGSGKNTAVVEFSIGEDKITFTIKTDKETLGAALSEHGLIEGEDGLYTKINGITADYNVDKSYWAFYIDGEYALSGIDDTTISDTKTYAFVYSK